MNFYSSTTGLKAQAIPATGHSQPDTTFLTLNIQGAGKQYTHIFWGLCDGSLTLSLLLMSANLKDLSRMLLVRLSFGRTISLE